MMRPVHPGEILRERIKAIGMSSNQFARAIRVPTNRVTTILLGKRSVTADTALRLERFFGAPSAQFWMSLQMDHDLAIARKKCAKELRMIQPLRIG